MLKTKIDSSLYVYDSMSFLQPYTEKKTIPNGGKNTCTTHFTADHSGDKSSTLANVSIRVSLYNLKHVSLCYYITSNDISETFF